MRQTWQSLDGRCGRGQNPFASAPFSLKARQTAFEPEISMTDTQKAAAEPDYSATLFLPETDFPMRAGLPEREPGWLKRWEEMDLYSLQRQQAKDRPVFTL